MSQQGYLSVCLDIHPTSVQKLETLVVSMFSTGFDTMSTTPSSGNTEQAVSMLLSRAATASLNPKP